MSAAARTELRRASSLVLYWEDDRLVVHDYRTGKRIAADPIVTHVLHFFTEWRTADAFAAAMVDYDAVSARRAVAALERRGLLIRRSRRRDATSDALQAWAYWNPAAGFFHLSTKDVRYTPRVLREVEDSGRPPMPPPVKRYRSAPRVRLPRGPRTGEFIDVLQQRRTWRQFARRRLTVGALATLLDLTFGVRSWLDGRGGLVPQKTSPSGGARHPVEAYVWARRVAGLRSGLYHYVSDCHELERLGGDRLARAPVTRYLPTQTWFNPAGAIVIMTAVFPRVQWKYPFARAYRVVLADAGHVAQTFCLTATWLGLAPFCSMALADSRIERDLGIDGITESVVYLAGVGTRPERVPLRPGHH